jgi:activator of HSP90 ATPase
VSSSRLTRRVFAAGLLATPAAFAAGRALAAADAGSSAADPAEVDGVSHGAASIRQQVDLAASPHRVYEALLDQDEFDKIVRLSAAAAFATRAGAAPTHIDRKVGGAFSLFGGYITGLTIEMVPDVRVVQVWRAGSWDAGAYSIARFELTRAGSATRLILEHRGFPDDQAAHLAAGWHHNYWEPMTKFLAQG